MDAGIARSSGQLTANAPLRSNISRKRAVFPGYPVQGTIVVVDKIDGARPARTELPPHRPNSAVAVNRSQNSAAAIDPAAEAHADCGVHAFPAQHCARSR